MSTFKKLFGVDKGAFRKHCVILPFASADILAGLSVKKIIRGKLYGCAHVKNYSVIHTGLGASLTGDAVLYLQESACEKLFLFGGCGSTGVFSIGDLVTVSAATEEENFSKNLLNPVHREGPSFYPDRELQEKIEKTGMFRRANGLTVSSLKLEEERLGTFRAQSIDVVDMECSAFFAAARFIKRKAVSLLVVTDVIRQKPFYETLCAPDKKNLQHSIKRGTRFLCDFIETDIERNLLA